MAGVDGNARRRSMDEHRVGRHLHSTGRRSCVTDRRRCSSGHDEDDDRDQDVIIDTHQQQRHQFHHHHPHPRVLPIDNYSDVYGGPPRSGTTILLGHHDRRFRRLSDNHLGTPGSAATATSAANFYEEIFCSPAAPQTDVLCHVQCRHVNRADTINPHPGHERTAPSPLVHSRTTRRGKRSSTNAGRNLPGFSIPQSSSSPEDTSAESTTAKSSTMDEGFYDDIFGCSNYGNINSSGGYRRRNTTSSSRASSCNCGMSASSSKSNYPISISKSKSKSKASDSSSSVLSSEDTPLALSPPPGPNSYITNCILQPPPSHHQDFRLHHCGQQHPRGDEDKDEKEDIILSFASKLRPITIPTRSTRSRSSSEYEYDPSPPPSAILHGDGDTFADDAGSSRYATVMSNSTVNPMLSTTSTNTTATTSVDQYLSSLSPPPPSPNPKKSSLYNLDVFQHQYQHHQSGAFNTALANPTGSPPDVARTAAAAAGGGGGGGVNTCDYAPGSPSSDLFSIYMEPPTTKMTGTQSKSMMEIRITQQDQNAGEEIYAGKSKSETDQGVCIKGIDDGNEASTRVMSIFTKREETEGSAAYGEEIDWAKEFWNRAGPTAGG